MAYNYSKLLGRIKEKGFTQESLAKAIGICATSMNKRLRGHSEFKISEIVAICHLLDIPLDQIPAYFFVH